MKYHNIILTELEETNIFKEEEVCYPAQYFYCAPADEYYAEETQIAQNDISMKNAYRLKTGLLTSDEIIAIRQKYDISQSDLALLLGWGEKTITRYEGHQVQDVAHDSILRKIDSDPDWYLELLDSYADKHSLSSFAKYRETALSLFERQKDEYMKKSIYSLYAKYPVLSDFNGYTKLNIDKVVEVIRYFSNSRKIKSLYKVKLMKLLWYSDALSYKLTNHTLTGLVYKALPMGAFPVAGDLIIELCGVNYEEVDFSEDIGLRFINDGNDKYADLSPDEISVLDIIIKRFGDYSKNEIVESMHSEDAYKETTLNEVISFNYAKSLSL